MPDASDEVYKRGLSYVLRTRDVDMLRDFLKAEAERRDLNMIGEVETITQDDLETRMYKMILARPDLGDIHADARRWLKDRDKSVHF